MAAVKLVGKCEPEEWHLPTPRLVALRLHEEAGHCALWNGYQMGGWQLHPLSFWRAHS